MSPDAHKGVQKGVRKRLQGLGPLSMPPLYPRAWPAGQYSSPSSRPLAASPAESAGPLRAESESASVSLAHRTGGLLPPCHSIRACMAACEDGCHCSCCAAVT